MKVSFTLTLLLGPWTTALSQSTSNVGTAEAPRRLEVMVGKEFRDSEGNAYTFSERSVSALAIGVRMSTDGDGGVRVMLRGYQATDHNVFNNGTTAYTSDVANDVVAAVVMSDWMLRLLPGLTIAPSVGAGVAPYVNIRRTFSPSTQQPNTSAWRASLVWSSGVAVRYGHLTVEQDLSGLIGSPHDMVTNPFMPVMIGWRF